MTMSGRPRAVGGWGIKPGLGELSFWESYPSTYFANTGTLTANNPYWVLVKRDNPLVIGHFDIYVASASGNVDVGLYTYSGGNMVPIWTPGSTPMAGTNAFQTFTLPTPYGLAAGAEIFAEVVVDNATAQLGRIGALAQQNVGQAYSKSATYPSPTVPSAVSSGAGAIPYIKLRA